MSNTSDRVTVRKKARLAPSASAHRAKNGGSFACSDLFMNFQQERGVWAKRSEVFPNGDEGKLPTSEHIISIL